MKRLLLILVVGLSAAGASAKSWYQNAVGGDKHPDYPSGGFYIPSGGLVVADPCAHLPDGDYNLEGPWLAVFPYIDSRCNFVKCSYSKSVRVRCGSGTRNNDFGRGFCQVHDEYGVCGVKSPKFAAKH